MSTDRSAASIPDQGDDLCVAGTDPSVPTVIDANEYAEARSAAPIRHPACVEAWPECEEGAYNPSCCRFPKSCSCTIRQDAPPSDAALSADEALAAINALRCNVVATQSAGWSNLMYPLVAILNAAGFSYAAPTDEQTAEHRNAYGGAGGWPGKGQTA